MTEKSYPRFFNAAELGASLKEVATDVIATKSGYKVVSRWFHSAKDADLFIWVDERQNIIKQQITFYGQVVEWNVVEGVKTGVIVEDETPAKIDASEVVHFDSRAQKPPIEQANALLKHIPALSELEIARLVGNFASESHSPAMDPQEFVDRFGPYLERATRGGPSGFWPWLRRLFGLGRR